MTAAVAEHTPEQPNDEDDGHGLSSGPMSKLVIGASGVVFGDIGTSPLYALQETMVGPHPLPVNELHIFGVISLIFWTMILIVTIKYVFVIMHADNEGEGGSLALIALIKRKTGEQSWTPGVIALGLFATALFYADSMITPAVSVLSAVEGLKIVSPALGPLVLPIALFIIVGLFLIQARGTDSVGKLFGPVMLIYFVVIAVLGVVNIWPHPDVLFALSPHHIVTFFVNDPLLAFLSLSSVILAVTGAEALYADMGHFGREPITRAWLMIVFPALIINYLGQASLMMANPEASHNLFYLMAPAQFRLPLVVLATLATIIASQAVITGAYSVTQQAIQLGFMPRMQILHTSSSAAGQIYLPVINWALLIMVMLLVVSFGSSAKLLPAYGLAVMGTMFITALMLGVMIFKVWKKRLLLGGIMLGVFLLVDTVYLASNVTKIPDGGWFPLTVGVVIMLLLTTWARGRQLMIARMAEGTLPIKVFISSAASSATRVRGTAVFMTSSADGVPHALLHNLKHNKVLHERIVLLTVKIANVPQVDEEKRCKMDDLGSGFHRMVLKYGFMEEPNVPAALSRVTACGPAFKMLDTSFFLARQTLLASSRPGMAIWREKLFAWMLRNAESAMEFFRLPTNRVVELGSQVEI